MPTFADGPASPLFTPVPIAGNTPPDRLAEAGLSELGRRGAPAALAGDVVCWGIPFTIAAHTVVDRKPVEIPLGVLSARWLVFMHAADVAWPDRDEHGLFPASKGNGRLGERAAVYHFMYSDGSSEEVPIRRRFQVGSLWRGWGDNCFEAVAYRKPLPVRLLSEQPRTDVEWGWAQTRVVQPDSPSFVHWLWAWENPHPDRTLGALRILPGHGPLVLSAISAGRASENPIRWRSRRKAVLRLPEGKRLARNLEGPGLLPQIQLDMGQVISASPRFLYPTEGWPATANNEPPGVSGNEAIVEYTCHPDARFHLEGGIVVAAAEAEANRAPVLAPVAPATQRVRLRVTEKGSGKLLAAKLHIHGAAGEYLQPVDRHRIPDAYWYEDWSTDYVNADRHICTYIDGETVVDLPVGPVFVEVSKGFEIRPIRREVEVTAATRELEFEVDHVLPWRAQGWVTADTHVHFLSPQTAHLEGSAEGVNVVNLLASQWGELMTNVGDFDGRTTWGSKEAGGDGEFLVRVGTENRQHVLGHISLLGYEGRIIAPMTVGGPDEAALGDPVDVLLTEWARMCRAQEGLVVVPHFPNPRAEHAAAILAGEVDGVEMTSWGNLYAGIDPYSLSDWYRYLNLGRFVAAVGGTDKMAANTAVGAVRTYARLAPGRPFTYGEWKAAVRSGDTFVTYGPLVDMTVEGKRPGSRMKLDGTGGTLGVDWKVQSVTTPMKQVDLVVNGEIRGSRPVDPLEASGRFTVKVERSSWVALLVRGKLEGHSEMIAAHTSPVMVEVGDTGFFSAADAVTVLDQIEGALAYIDTVGTRAETSAYRRMRLALTAVHRELHNRMHQAGAMHEHTPATNHPEHASGG